MQVNWKFIFLVGVVSYLWYPTNEHDILVLVNSSTFAIARLKEIKNLKAAFKISRNIYNEIKEVPDSFKTETKWNLVLIIGNEYDGDYSKINWNGERADYSNLYKSLQTTYEGITKLNFINDAALFPYTENVALRHFYNIRLFFQQLITEIFPWIFEKQLTRIRKNRIYLKIAEQESVCSDEAIHAATHKRLVVINLIKLKDMEAWREYESTISKYLPSLDTRYVSIGVADSLHWSEVSFVSYSSRTKFCEMMMSKEVITYAMPSRHRAVNESQTYTTFQIMECHPIFRGCRPVDGYRTRDKLGRVVGDGGGGDYGGDDGGCDDDCGGGDDGGDCGGGDDCGGNDE